MFLEELIDRLKKEDPNTRVPVGFHNPHSYRGDYFQVAFEPVENVTIGEMLECAKEALGTTYTGYKGGNFTMHGCTHCYLANRGRTGEEIGNILIDYMIGKYHSTAQN